MKCLLTAAVVLTLGIRYLGQGYEIGVLIDDIGTCDGVSIQKAFERECDVRPIDFGGRHLKRWDRFDLDAWIDRRKEGAATLSAGDWLARAGDDSRAG